MIFQKDRAMTTWAAMVWVLVVMCCATGGAWGQQAPGATPQGKPLSASDIQKLIKRYVTAEGDAKAATLAELEASSQDVLRSSADVRRYVKVIVNEARRARPGVVPQPTDVVKTFSPEMQQGLNHYRDSLITSVQTPDGPMRIIMVDDTKKNHVRGKPPLMIFLHGGGKAKVDWANTWAWVTCRDPASKFTGVGMTVLPRCMDDNAINSWVMANHIRDVEMVLDEILRCYDIDPQHIYLGGYSMGGFGAWNHAAMIGDRFTGIVGMAGGACLMGPAEFGNMRNVNFGCYIGQEDKDSDRIGWSRKGRDGLQTLQKDDPTGYHLSYHEYPGQGHGLNDAVFKEADQWLRSAKRNTYPRIVVWNPVVEWKTRFYNIAVAKPRKGMKIRAEMKEDNTVVVTSTDVPELTVYLNEQLVDMKKPVKVIWNGQPAVEVEPVLRLSVMLQTLTEHYDEGMFYTFKVELKGKP